MSAESPTNGPLPRLPARDPRGHKGTFGTVVVIGGQAMAPRLMLGGPALSARAALRAGCGLVVLAMPEPLLVAALGVAAEATGVALACDGEGEIDPSASAETLDRFLPTAQAIALGPGFGAREAQRQVVMRLVSADAAPMVIDADALNALSETERFDLDFRARAILTPHPGEFARLAARLGLELDPTAPERRRDAAERLAQRLGAVVVLKGAGTVVSDGLRTWVAEVGNAALASAGSGDVLTGIAASFVAQFHRGSAGAAPQLDLFDCARLAVQVHGLAADRWASRHGDAGLLAHELCDLVPDVLAALRGEGT